MSSISDLSKKDPDFSLVAGGPLFQLLLRLKLITPSLALQNRRIAFFILLTWLPLFLLSLLSGKAWGSNGLPFLFDIEAQSRFLVALPLLIAAERLVHDRLRLVVGQFLERKIIPAAMLPKFNEAITSGMNLRNSLSLELFILLLVFVGGPYLWSSLSNTEHIASSMGSWYATGDSQGIHLSPAGYWYTFFSRPLFQFMGYRWYFRLLIWAYFLWQCSRLRLNLIPTHPDRAAGLGFLGLSPTAFSLLLMAHGVLVAGLIANSIFYEGAKLTDFTTLILAVLAFLLLIVLGPLFAFSAEIINAKRAGLREYGMLASEYMHKFDLKWIRGVAVENAPLLGSSDIQSLADMGNSFQVVNEIKPFPFGRDAVLLLIVLTLIPIFPLVLTMIPLEQLIREILTSII